MLSVSPICLNICIVKLLAVWRANWQLTMIEIFEFFLPNLKLSMPFLWSFIELIENEECCFIAAILWEPFEGRQLNEIHLLIVNKEVLILTDVSGVKEELIVPWNELMIIFMMILDVDKHIDAWWEEVIGKFTSSIECFEQLWIFNEKKSWFFDLKIDWN